MSTNELSEIDIKDALAAKVRASEPIYVIGPLNDAVGKMHLAMVNRLRDMTGMLVHEIHN